MDGKIRSEFGITVQNLGKTNTDPRDRFASPYIDTHVKVKFLYESVHEKTNNFGSDQVRHKPGCIFTEDG